MKIHAKLKYLMVCCLGFALPMSGQGTYAANSILVEIAALQRGMANVWADDGGKATTLFTNAVEKIKSIENERLRKETIFALADSVLSLDILENNSNLTPFMKRRWFFEDTLDLLGSAVNSIVDRWMLRLKYYRKLKSESAELMKRVDFNSTDLSDRGIKRVEFPSNESLAERKRRTRDEVMAWSKAKHIKIYSEFIRQSIEEETSEYDKKEGLMNDCKRLPQEMREALLQEIWITLGRYPKWHEESKSTSRLHR